MGLGAEDVRLAPRTAVTVKEAAVPGATRRKVQAVAPVRQVSPLGFEATT